MNTTKERTILAQSDTIHIQGLLPVRVVRGRDEQGYFTCLEVKKQGVKGLRGYIVNTRHFDTIIEAIRDYHRRLSGFF